MACKLLIAGVLGASLLSTAAFATVTPLGNLDPPNAGAFGDINPTGPVTDAGTFDLTVSADTALRLARFFRTSPEFWVSLQAMHDLTKARQETGETIERDIQPRAA